jgi:hypothetical protein
LNASSTAFWKSYGPPRPSAIRHAVAVFQARTDAIRGRPEWNEQMLKLRDAGLEPVKAEPFVTHARRSKAGG